ncbi:hypothetical protein [Solimonas variicoloris]|uniref:hypothetical protein n=1 Tax=Solimonas variicoloris TaxID=254408 RepID=UPI00036E5A07|nr:hypothetical protein [Solimonas variicoloris]
MNVTGNENSALIAHLGAHGITVRAVASDAPAWRDRVERWWPMTTWLAQNAVGLDALFGKLNYAAREAREQWPAQSRQSLVVGEYGRETLERAQGVRAREVEHRDGGRVRVARSLSLPERGNGSSTGPGAW